MIIFTVTGSTDTNGASHSRAIYSTGMTHTARSHGAL